MTGPSVWGWQPPRRVARLLLGLPSSTVGVRERPVREQEGALWCLLKRQVSLHMCRQGSWKRELGQDAPCGRGGGTRVQSPWWGSRGWHQGVRSPWGAGGGTECAIALGPLQTAKSPGPGATSELQKALSEDKLSFIHVVLKKCILRKTGLN